MTHRAVVKQKDLYAPVTEGHTKDCAGHSTDENQAHASGFESFQERRPRETIAEFLLVQILDSLQVKDTLIEQ